MNKTSNQIRMTRIAQDELSHLLRQHIEVLPSVDGVKLCRYKGDWSDEKIFQEWRKNYPTMNVRHVANYRYAVHGSLAPMPRSGPRAGSLKPNALLVAYVLHQLCTRLGAHDLAKKLTVEPNPQPKDGAGIDDLIDRLFSEQEQP